MNRNFRITISVLILTLLFSCSGIKLYRWGEQGQDEHNPADYGFHPAQHVKRDIVYAPGLPGTKRLMLDVHWNDSESPKPLAIVIHGGGWIIMDKSARMEELTSELLAANGYVAININYRMLPKYPVETCIEDTFGAVVWAKEHASEFGGDPTRVGATGTSAGGHLTAMLATAGNRMDVFTPTGHKGSKYDASVLVAVPFYGAYDMNTVPRDIFPIPMMFNHIYMKMLFNGKPEENAEYGRKISPVTYISADTPPQYVVCGEADSLKLYPQAVEYVEALKKAGRPVEFMSIPGADHSFNSHYWTPESQKAHQAIVDQFDKYLK